MKLGGTRIRAEFFEEGKGKKSRVFQTGGMMNKNLGL